METSRGHHGGARFLIRQVFALWVFSAALFGQTAQTIPYRAVMQPAGTSDSGAADILVHIVQDASGAILSGSIDFDLTYQFAADESVTGLVLTNGTLTIATGITASSPVQATGGSGRIRAQAQAPAASLSSVLANSGSFSVVLSTASSPASAMSGPLQSGFWAVRMALVNSSAGSGLAAVRVLYSGAPYAVTSAEVFVQLSYQFSGQVTFSGLRIDNAQTGQIGVAAELAPGTQSASGGSGALSVPATEIDMSNSQMVQAVQAILTSPSSFKVDVDTVQNSAAPLTGPLQDTGSLGFQIPGFAGTNAASTVALYTLRDAAGNLLAGTVLFDVNYRLTAGAQITGLDIDGSVVSPAVSTDASGSGNAYTAVGVYSGAGLTSITGLDGAHPEAHQINLHATPASAASSAAMANTGGPSIVAVIPIAEVKSLSTFAPGEIVEIYGTDLAKLTTGLNGRPVGPLPASMNGVSITLGGQTGRILYVSPNQVDALFAFESPTGAQLLTLNNGNSASAAFPITLAEVAPAVYSLVYKNADFTPVSASNPAHAGDILVLYLTGMGQTTPALVTGQITPSGPPFFDTMPATVTFGSTNASVAYSISAPPFVTGLYQLAVTVPAGLGAGTFPVVVTAGGLASNPVMVEVQ